METPALCLDEGLCRAFKSTVMVVAGVFFVNMIGSLPDSDCSGI